MLKLLVIREMQIKTTVRYLYLPVRMPKKKFLMRNLNMNKDVEQLKLSYFVVIM